MTKNSIQVVITTNAGFSATADDETLAGQGSAAYAELMGKRDITIVGESSTTYIPHDAVDHAVVTITTSTEEDPADDTCPQE